MIKIRYSDLPTGLHVQTAVEGRHTIIYLLPGLTAAERRSAILRVRGGARIGYGPPLPAAPMAAAVITDRIRATLGNIFTALRVHPALFVPAAFVIASVVVAYLLLASGSIQFRDTQSAGPGLRPGIQFGLPRGPQDGISTDPRHRHGWDHRRAGARGWLASSSQPGSHSDPPLPQLISSAQSGSGRRSQDASRCVQFEAGYSQGSWIPPGLWAGRHQHYHQHGSSWLGVLGGDQSQAGECGS